MLLKDKEIAIVGGGPGGLTLASLLQLKKLNVKVYERDLNKEVRVQGATLDLHEESGLEALRRAGLIEQFHRYHRPDAGKMRILDQNNTIHLDDHLNESSYENNRPEIDRGPLRKIFLESLQPETVAWDSHFISMEKENNGWILHFKNGTSAYADLVIAADGAHSKIRRFVTDIKPVYSGITIVEGNIYNAEINVPKLYSLLRGGKVFAFGEEKSMIMSSKGDGSLSFYTGCKVDENWAEDSGIDFSNKQQVFDWFKNEFKNWNKDWLELFSSDEVWFVSRPQYHYPLDQTWESLSNLTLIGDAAHKMPPYAGEGVNMAMQDAFELADCLMDNEFTDVQSAISDYEKKMQKRASEVTEDTLKNTEMLHSKDAVEKMVNMMNGEEL
jgi:2-polyprenyl-6-methoxyphenol hydroxylase-like FAD-dependent oxidoreductase